MKNDSKLNEKQLQAKILKYLKAKGAYVIKVITATRSGVPDILACYKGQFVAIEVKGPGGKPSTLQLHNIVEIEAAGGQAIVAWSMEEVVNLLK